jgi:hypothetical protein
MRRHVTFRSLLIGAFRTAITNLVKCDPIVGDPDGCAERPKVAGCRTSWFERRALEATATRTSALDPGRVETRRSCSATGKSGPVGAFDCRWGRRGDDETLNVSHALQTS